MHWEWDRFELRVPRRWFGKRTVYCQLVAGDGVPETPLAVIGRQLPDDWRHHHALSFRVTADVTPLAEGSFGHRGWLRWKLRVDRWLEVVPLTG